MAQIKITYATMSGDRMEDLHRELDRAIDSVRASFGQQLPADDRRARGPRGEPSSTTGARSTRASCSARSSRRSREQARDAIAAARAAYPAWSARPWRERVALLKKVADGIRARRWELSALMGYEAGKNRLECVGDVEESADLIEYYCNQIEQHDGFATKLGTLGPNEENSSVLRPVRRLGGDLAVQFPARARGRAGRRRARRRQHRRLQAGVGDAAARLHAVRSDGARRAFRPASSTSSPAAAAPPARSSIDNPDVDGIVFTGSKDVGMHLIRDNAARARAAAADHRDGRQESGAHHARRPISTRPATASCARRSARRARSARPARASTSAKPIRDEFVRLLVEKTKKIKIGNPLESRRLPGAGHQRGRGARPTSARSRRRQPDGGTILTGGRRLTDGEFAHGYFVEPTIIDGLPADHPLFSEELFVPITVVGDVTTLDEAIELANGTEYGLTAGIFSEDDREIERFFDRIQAGVTYANRRAGATTGAWPGINSFGGWKASGSTGRGTGGPYYVQQFMREQSRVRIR